jgi:hemerythrin-like domain-containing protein
MTSSSQEPPPGASPARRIPRRGLLIGGAGIAGLAVGAGGTAAGYEFTTADPAATSTIPPSEDLMREHGVLKRVLLIYREAGRRISTDQRLPARPVHDAAQIIHDYIEGFHEGLEEAYVFPRLQHTGRLVDTVRTLLIQHARGRRLTADILADTTAQTAGRQQLASAMDAFVRMYEPHEAREDTVVFPTLRAITPAATFTRLGEHFADLETKQFGKNAFTEMVERVAAIEHALGINDLAHFTPPPS